MAADANAAQEPGRRGWFHLFSVFLVIELGAFGWYQRPVEMGIATAGLLVALAFTQLHRFQRFKGAGFEAEMRKIEAATQQAYASIEQVRELAGVVAHVTLDVLGRSGLFGKLADPEKVALRIRLEDTLAKIGVDAATISGAAATFDSVMKIRHAKAVRDAALKSLGVQGKGGEQVEAAEKLDTLLDHAKLRAAPPEEYQRLLSQLGLISPEVEDSLRDYEHYLQHRVHRRPQLWD